MKDSKKIDQRVVTSVLAATVVNPIIDAWIVMLSLGALSELLALKQLAISYWASLLIVIISVSLIPQNYRMSEYLKLIAKGDRGES